MAFSLESDSLKVSALILHQQSAALKGPCHCHQQMRRQLRRNHGGELTMPKVCEINEVLLCVACFSLSLLLGVRTTTSNVPRCLSCRTSWLCEPLCTSSAGCVQTQASAAELAWSVLHGPTVSSFLTTFSWLHAAGAAEAGFGLRAGGQRAYQRSVYLAVQLYH